MGLRMTHLTCEQLADYLRKRLSPDGNSVCALHLARCSKCRNALHQLHSDECYCRKIRGLLTGKRKTLMIKDCIGPEFKKSRKERIISKTSVVAYPATANISITGVSGKQL